MIIVKKKKRKKYPLAVVVLVVVSSFIIVFLNKYTYGMDNNIEKTYSYMDGFSGDILSEELKDKITGNSFPLNEDVIITYDDLRYLKLKYWDFSGNLHDDGEMIVNKLVADEVLQIFYILYLNQYPINKIKLVEEYNASDELSMRDNNTSAFNYRIVEDDNKLSWHAFGLAIDINPLYNPYIVGDNVYPETATSYVDRKREFIGKIDHDDLAYTIFTKYGWRWGGDFLNTKDYQHFYKDIYDNSIRLQ